MIETFNTERVHDWLFIQQYQEDASTGTKRFVPMQRCTHLGTS